MIDRSFHRTVHQTLTSADKVGAKIPPAIRQKLDAALALVDSIDTHQFTGTTLEDAVINALAAGRDPETDPDVHAALTGKTLHNLRESGTLTDTARARLYDLTRENIEAIIAAFQPPYTAAATTLAEAHATITKAGYTDLKDSGISNRNLELATANLVARQQLDTMRTIDQAATVLTTALNKIPGTSYGRLIQTVDTGNASDEDLRLLNKRNLNPWEALNHGYTPSLATPAETLDRINRAQGIQAQRERAHTDRQRDAVRTRFGSPVKVA